MDQFRVVELLGQASGAEVGDVFREFLRSHVRLMIADVMAAEVTELCGAKYGPRVGSEYQRAGSAEGKVLLEGRGETVKRPRVRKRVANGSTKEVSLETYGAAQDPAQLQESIVRALVAGVSGREMQEVHPESPRVSKSSVSRLWKAAGTRFVDELRSRDIASPEWVALMLDGIVLSKAQTAIVALGVMRDGTKQILDFDLGSSENFEVCRDLLDRLVARGFAVSHRLFSVLDGSQSLKKALLAFFPDAVIQRCLIHKERNLKAKLSRRDWGELSRLFKRLREVQGESAAREVLGELEQFLERKNAAALASHR
jgi:transposase-like protein